MQPLTIRYAFIQGLTDDPLAHPEQNVLFTKPIQMKIRDKYIKIRVKYDGTKLAIINAIRTLFTISYN
jgi:hypothetical protein